MKNLLKNCCVMSVAALLLFPMFAFGQRTVTIKGNVKFIENDFKVGVYRFSGTLKQLLAETTVDPTTHNYTLSVPADKIGEAMVDCGGWQAVNVWLQDEDMDIDFRGVDTAAIKIKNPPFVYIKGGKNNELMNLLNFDAYRNYQSMIVYSQKTYVTKFADEENQKSLTNALYDFMGDDYDARCRYYVEHYADRPSVMVAIEQLDYEKNKKLIDDALARLATVSPQANELVAQFHKDKAEEKIRIERVKVGAPMPAFECKSPKGKTLRPANFKGKVLVLDFWASWCGPCRQEIPNLKKIYADFKDKGVEFMSVSIDGKRDAWVKAMGEEGMPWHQGWVSDGGKEVMDLYQFSGIPFILIIDKDGRIYRKHVRGDEIRKGVEDVLAGKAPAEEKDTSISMGAMSM